MLFCIVFLGFSPRLATERNDSGENRLEKIRGLIERSKYSIHDLSRCQAQRKGEHFRLNMPFELGIDFGCRQYFGRGREEKRFLILEAKRYRFQAAISDISGSDICAYGDDPQLAPQNAVKHVRNWLVSEAAAMTVGAKKIWDSYCDFQECISRRSSRKAPVKTRSKNIRQASYWRPCKNGWHWGVPSHIQLLHEPCILADVLEPQFRFLAHQALDKVAGLAGFVLVD